MEAQEKQVEALVNCLPLAPGGPTPGVPANIPSFGPFDPHQSFGRITVTGSTRSSVPTPFHRKRQLKFFSPTRQPPHTSSFALWPDSRPHLRTIMPLPWRMMPTSQNPDKTFLHLRFNSVPSDMSGF